MKSVIEKIFVGKGFKPDFPSSILIAPAAGSSSFLSNNQIIQTLISTQNHFKKFAFMVKLHPYCFLEKHPLHSISSIESQNVEKLKKNFIVVDESEYSELPLLEAFDLIITDFQSSIPIQSY